jgi:hypothetical protein
MWQSDISDGGAAQRREAARAASRILAELLIEHSGRQQRSQLSGLRARHGRTGSDPEMPEKSSFAATLAQLDRLD